MRLFFAIYLPDDVRDQIYALQSDLRGQIGQEGVRWEDPNKLHITLRFLGEVSQEDLESVKQAGKEAAENCPPFSLVLRGIGSFPEDRQPRVLWAGASRGLPEFTRLAEYLEGSLTKRGFAREHRPAKPHVTLARIKSPQGAKSVQRVISSKDLKKVDKEGVISVCNVVLVHSELRPSGSVYTILETFDLAKA